MDGDTIKSTLLLTAFFLLTGCKDTTTTDQSESASSSPPGAGAVFGNYVSDGYEQRAQGYDWVSVAVTEQGSNSISIKVRSRADKKNPTCTLDATAFARDSVTYTSTINDKLVAFTFNDNELMITSESSDDGFLSFYCSGGSTVAGKYLRISGEIDTSQVDKTTFSRVLQLQGIGFNITAIEVDGKNRVTITPFGLDLDNRPESIEIYGELINAEIEDLNSDGSPEVLIYVRSQDQHRIGAVYGYSVNNRKPISQIYFPPVGDNSDLNSGYRGHDEFALVETNLIQRFPVFENNTKKGNTRQIRYVLVDGEAMRSFKVDQVVEF